VVYCTETRSGLVCRVPDTLDCVDIRQAILEIIVLATLQVLGQAWSNSQEIKR
jgi:hypothetical protein